MGATNLQKEKMKIFYQLKKIPKTHEPLSSRGGGTLTLVVRPLNKNLFYARLPLRKVTISSFLFPIAQPCNEHIFFGIFTKQGRTIELCE